MSFETPPLYLAIYIVSDMIAYFYAIINIINYCITAFTMGIRLLFLFI